MAPHHPLIHSLPAYPRSLITEFSEVRLAPVQRLWVYPAVSGGRGLRPQAPANLSTLMGETAHTAMSRKLGRFPDASPPCLRVSCE